MSRIQLISGYKPYLIIAPHGGGPTDIRSAQMAQTIAKKINAFAVINIGWVRPWIGNQEGDPAVKIDVKKDISKGIANLNDLTHCRTKALKKEFLHPIDLFKKSILSNHKMVNIFIIHGMDDTIRDYKGVNVVIGHGNGNPPRLTCSNSFKERLLGALALENLSPAQGKAGGRLSAWENKNLNQLYQTDDKVFSVQIEIGLSLRNTDKLAEDTANKIASAIDKTCSIGSIPFLKNIPER